MARRRLKDPAEAAADRAVEELVERPQARVAEGKRPTPYTVNPQMGRFARVVETVIDEAAALDEAAVLREYEELERRLVIREALTPEVIRREQNEVDHLAYRAHRLYVLARITRDLFDAEAAIALASMRENAALELENEKDAGKRSKAPTIQDIQDRAAAKYPDEWRDINRRQIEVRKAVENLENLAERWARRSWTLASMAGS